MPDWEITALSGEMDGEMSGGYKHYYLDMKYDAVCTGCPNSAFYTLFKDHGRLMTLYLKSIHEAWQQYPCGYYDRAQWRWSVLIVQARLKVNP